MMEEKPKVLIVEDEKAHAEALSEGLSRSGYDCTIASTGLKAVNLLAKETFDLVVTDLILGSDIDGLAVLQATKQHSASTEVILITAHASVASCREALRDGAYDYVTKPIDGDQLLRTVAGALGVISAAPGSGSNNAIAKGTEVVQTAPAAPKQAVSCGVKSNPADRPLFSTLPMEDPDFREIVEEFIQRLQDQLAAMQRALDTQDLPELSRLAHWLKGAGGTAGFPAFTQPAKHLEALVQDQQCDEIEATLAELLDLSQQIVIYPVELVTTLDGEVDSTRFT